MEHVVQFPIQFVGRATSSVPLSELEEYAARRLNFTLRRFGHVVRGVTLRLTDENGPRRGIDTRCSMTMHVEDGPPLLVEATSAWPAAAITDAAKRLREMLQRRLDREHTVSRRKMHVDRTRHAR